jgi:hypothetical protein
VRSTAVRGACVPSGRRTDTDGWPDSAIPGAGVAVDDAAMPVLAATRDRSVTRSFASALAGLTVGTILLAGGILLGYLLLTAGIVERFTVPARPTPAEMAAGVLAWTFALVVPAGFAVVGALRLLDAIGITRHRPRIRPAARAAHAMPADHLVASRVRLPDGRLVPELIVGPFGVVVVGELPPAGASRHSGGRWEVRVDRGRWIPIENPIERTSRDAERVRRWLGSNDSDHVVRVHAVLIDPDRRVERTPTCAVTTVEELPVWLASLPAQRSFVADRQARVAETVRESLDRG